MMKNKKLLKFLTVFIVLLILVGCHVPEDAQGNPIYITLDTTFKDMSDLKSGIFDMLLTYPLAQAINFLADKTNIFLAITLVTLILNIILLGLTFKSNVSTQKMQEIQPEIERIQKKYEGNDSQSAKAQMSQEMQRLFEKNDINPLASFAAFLQLPVFLCMYAAIRRSYAVANGVFLGATLKTTPREAIASGNVVLIVIYICMIAFQFLSTMMPQIVANYKKKKLAEKQHKPFVKNKNSNGMMMYGMVVLIAFAMLTWPTALSLYYAIVSLINVLKVLLIELLMKKKGVA